VLPIYFAIPDGAWERMKNWRSIARIEERAECQDVRGLEPARRRRRLRGARTGADHSRPGEARSMVNKRSKYTLDLREKAGAPLFVELIARPTHAACVMALRQMIAGNPIRDLAGQDVTSDDDPGMPR
jgi:hypothetical protein